MAAIPICLARRGEFWVMGTESNSISPPSKGTAPVIILIRVDLPAPFSPISACTSPARNSNDACLNALTPAYDLSMLVARTRMRLVMIQQNDALIGRSFGVPPSGGTSSTNDFRLKAVLQTFLSTVPFLNSHVTLPGLFDSRRNL